MNLKELDIEEIAKQEFEEEKKREEIEKIKDQLRKKKSLWDMIFPFTITIRRK